MITFKANSTGRATGGSVLGNDEYDGSGTLTASLGDGPYNGTVDLASDGTFTYTPNPGFEGPDSFGYVVSDGVESSIGYVYCHIDRVTVVQVTGGAALLNWAGGTEDLDAGETFKIYGGDGHVSLTLLTQGANYTVATNGTLGAVSADPAVTRLELHIDTTPTFDRYHMGYGDISSITIPGGDSGGSSVLEILSRSSVGTVDASVGQGADGQEVYARGLDFVFDTLWGSLTTFDHINRISATGWLGSGWNSIRVNHGVDFLSAYGVGALTETNVLYAETDPESVVIIGDGGVQQWLSLGNVAEFTGSGDMNSLVIESLRGLCTLDGTITVQLFQFAEAQNAGINASQSTIETLRMQPGYRSETNRPNFFSRRVTLNDIGTFEIGSANSQERYRVEFADGLVLRTIRSFYVYGSIKAPDISITGSVRDVYASGHPLTTYAIDTGVFQINRFERATGFERFAADKSVRIAALNVQNGDLPILVINGDGEREGNFIGSIRVYNGNIQEIDIFSAIRLEGTPIDSDLIRASGTIGRVQARHIGGGEANSSLVVATAIEEIVARRKANDTRLQIPDVSVLATIEATNGNIGLVDATGGIIYSDLIARRGEVIRVLGDHQGNEIEQ